MVMPPTTVKVVLLCFIYSSLHLFELALAACTNKEAACSGGWGKKYQPLAGCKQYVECAGNEIKAIMTCMDGTLFDDRVQSCNWDFDVTCTVETCEPTGKPTTSPTTSSPSSYPSVEGSEKPSHEPSWKPSAAPTYNFFYTMETNTMKLAIQDTVLVAYNAMGIAYPSTRYTYDGMISALKEMADGIVSDGREFRLYVGKEEANLQYGRANLAAFLAMAMTESIAYDTCDEFNLDQVAGKYAISNSCGQNGRSYQDEVCTIPSEVKMSCNVDDNMVMVSASTTISQGGRPPPPFKCRPKEDWSDYAGYWDSRVGEASTNPYANALGRIDIEGCCWWGRGVLLTRGVCNIGRLNYYLGKRAYDERREGRFPSIDFCKNPEATCASDMSTETMRWITGIFDWIYRVQSYDTSDWSYINALQKFVDNGFIDDQDDYYSFIDAVSSVFVRDCHQEKCSNVQMTKQVERRQNFYKIMDVLRATETPTRRPTPRPTVYTEPTPPPSTPKVVIKPPPPAWMQPPPTPTGSVISRPTTVEMAPPNNIPSGNVIQLSPPSDRFPATSTDYSSTIDDSKEQPPQETDDDMSFEGGLMILDGNAACGIEATTSWTLLLVLASLVAIY